MSCTVMRVRPSSIESGSVRSISIASGTSAVLVTPLPSSFNSGARCDCAEAVRASMSAWFMIYSSRVAGRGAAESVSSTRTASLRPTRPGALVKRG